MSDQKSQFALYIDKCGGRRAVVEVIRKSTNERVFVDVFDLNSHRARSEFVNNLLDAYEIFTEVQLSNELRKTTAIAVHRLLLRAIDSSTCTYSESLPELSELAELSRNVQAPLVAFARGIRCRASARAVES